MANGFACMKAGEIMVSSVAATTRGAMVNYLVAEKRFMIHRWHDDNEIIRLFFANKDADVECVPIQVIRQRRPPSGVPHEEEEIAT